jgi:tetratricopeptide (TPR) repeat protein
MENNRLAALMAAYESRKDDPFVRYAIALELKEAGELQRSKEFFNELLATFPEYVPQYFHFGKLLEELEETDAARTMYVSGIQQCKNVGDMHALSEIRGALELLEMQI